MRTTGEFRTHQQVVTFDKCGEPIRLLFFGDVHKFAPLHSADEWARFVARARTLVRRENAWLVGMGDYMDLLSASERFAMRTAKLHEATTETLEDFYKGLVREMAKELSFARGRIVGLLEGNHFMEFGDGTTSTQLLAGELGCAYLGVCNVTLLHLRQSLRGCKNKKRAHGYYARTLQLALHHGRGSGRRVGAGFNTVEEMARVFEGADIYAMGDNHQRGGLPIQTLRAVASNGGKVDIRHHKIMLCRTGAFLRGYVEGKRSYVVDSLYAPSNLGWVEVTITPTSGGKVCDWELEATA